MSHVQLLSSDIVYPELSYQVTGLFFEVHNQLGRFANEKQYADAFEFQLRQSQIAYSRESHFAPSFDGEVVNRNRVDFLIDEKVIVELKAKRIVTKEDYFQIRRYLASSRLKLGIIVNFRQPTLSPKRILNSQASV